MIEGLHAGHYLLIGQAIILFLGFIALQVSSVQCHRRCRVWNASRAERSLGRGPDEPDYRLIECICR